MKTNLKRILALMAVLCMVLSAWGGVVAEEESKYPHKTDDGHTHIFENVPVKGQEPTCWSEGTAARICKECGLQDPDKPYVTLDQLYHEPKDNWEDWEIITPATCTEAGSERQQLLCKHCGYVLDEAFREIKALGHKWPEEGTEPVVDETVEPEDCTKTGTKTYVYYCLNGCGEKKVVKTEVIPPKAHTPGEAVEENVVEDCKTKTKTFDSVVYCTVCKLEISREKDQKKPLTDDELKKIHEKTKKTEKRNVVPATCMAEGSYDEVTFCPICEEVLSEKKDQVEKKLAHKWVDDTGHPDNKAATCGEDGIQYKFCEVCGTHDLEEGKNPVKVPATGEHVWSEDLVTIPATCMAEGSVTKFCTVCKKGEVVEVLKIDKENGHDWQKDDERSRPANCVKKGVQAYKCSICGERKAEEIPALNHDLVVLNSKAPTCTAIGWTAGQYCKREGCDGEAAHIKGKIGDKEYSDADYDFPGDMVKLIVAPSPIAPTGHTVLRKQNCWHWEPTCTEDGYNCFVCANCGQIIHEEVKALGHDFVIRNPEGDKAETCINSGYYAYVCTRCGATEQRYVEATGEHVFGEEITIEPTCRQSGRVYKVCEICGFESTEKFLPVNPDAHEWHEDWSDMKKFPTCEEDGIGKYYCWICGASKYDVYPASGHSPVEMPAIEPTCVDEGWTAGTICEWCGEILEDAKEIPATGHKLKKIGETDATCVKKGTVDYVCEVCGEEVKEENVLGDHFLLRWEAYDKAPSCVSGGAEAYICYYCDYVEYRPTGKADPTAHFWIPLEQISVPTCVSGALELYACYYCDARIIKESETSKADPTSHVWCDVGDQMACYYCDAVKAK